MKNGYLEPLWEAFQTYADYPAIVDRGGERSTSYGELREQVCRVVAWFDAQDIAPASFIPIILPQSMEYLAVEIGTWMAGYTAVPMGTAFPPDRIAYIREHCEAPFVVDEAAWAEIAKTDPADFGQDSPDYPPEEQPALLIYTSGSTGTPKGILHTFEGLNAKHTSKVGLRYSPDERWGMGAPLYFVASLTCFKVLKEGGQLHLYDAETYHDMRKLEDYIADHGITFTFLSPSMLASFHNRSETLKVVFTGSERLTGQCSRDGFKLLNCYGMTETGGTVTAYEVSRTYDTTPVGKPEEAWCLLDEDGNPVEPGEEGEFCLSGTYCAGYYKDPERTAELYAGGWLHTGDLLRELPDGNLVYVNRKDWMAKINGQRVEPGEVENACKKVDGVEQVVVKAFDGDTGGQFLCAFYTGEAKGEDIRTELARVLPPYMVPSFFVPVREFALLPNGKVNRKVLAAPDASSLKTDYVAPENETQARLCEAFSTLFGLERTGIDDDFFLLGGDSIRVMKLQQICNDLPLSAQMVSQARTPRKIADELAGAIAQHDAPRFERTPLSQTQLGIYVESIAREGEAVYNNPVLLRIDTAIDEAKLARAIEAAVQAHSFIKLHVKEDADGVALMVPSDQPYHQTVEQMSEDEFESCKATLIEPFDLHAGPLYRIRIIRTPDDLYLFSDFHHLIFDGTSMRVFMADVNAAYSGDTVPPETYNGFDVAAAEALARESQAYEKAKAWYENTFGGLDIDSVPLPDSSGSEIEFAMQDVALGMDAATVGRFCRRLGISENIFALAVFGKVLAAYANMDESLFATIYNGRSDVLSARTVDMMVKTLPVYCRCEADQRVTDYLSTMKSQVLGAMAHDLYSFAESSALAGVTSDVLFAYQGDYLALGSICGHPYERIDLGGNATGSPLDFQLFIVDGVFSLHVEYQRNLYSDAFVSDMARCYANVFSGMLSAERLGDIELCDPDQIAKLESFHGREVPYDQTQSVVSLFRSAAAAYPENTAAICEDAHLSYRKLDEVSERLAQYICGLGLGDPGDVVSVLIPRGLWMPMASLGVLKSGCAYQPLDATYPPERLNFMMQDADAKLLITTEELRPIISDYAGEVLIVDPRKTELPTADDTQPSSSSAQARTSEPDDLFILLYTSGTTGVPKGVRLTHGNLVCFINWYHRYFGLGPSHRVGAYASYGFDACMMDMYPALTCGAAVVIVPEEMRYDLLGMGAYLQRNGVTHAFMTTQVGRQFAIDAECPTLEHLSMGGETLVRFDAPERPLCHNVYGPTECTILSTTYDLVGGETSYPIGKPLDNMHAYIVSSDGHRLPPGATGELWLAGPQVGNGYLNRPDKTAEAFGTNPFAKGDYTHLYRTGDVVRWMPNGDIEFIGRRDGQVKIRGFRIELAEVEAIVRDFPGIRDATVAAFDHPSGGKYIAAYVVSDEPVDVAALGDFIRERKPPYMVPAATIQIDRIPLNQNGKVNRRILPIPDLANGLDAPEDDAPRTLNALEQELLDISETVIGASGFSVATPLARCGLTSIQSIRLLALVFKRFGVSIQAKDLPDDMSVETLENAILEQWMTGNVMTASNDAKGDAARPSEFRAPLTFAQMGVYYECRKNPDSLAYNIPALFSFDVATDPEKLASAVRAVVKAHPTLTARFLQEGESTLLVPADEMDMARKTMTEEELLEFRATFVRPFDLDTGPLSRFAVVSTPERTCLFTDFHHLAFDGSSMELFLRDLGSALEGADLKAETFSFADSARDEQRFADSPDFDENRRYLAELLDDFEDASVLPADLGGREADGKRLVAWEPFDMSAVEGYCQDAGITPAGFMLAATAYALSRYTNERRVHLATISNGRADVRVSDTIGMFVNTLPLSLQIDDETTAQFASRCADALAEAVAHERYPFARIAADHGFTPQVMYEYQLGVVEQTKLPGLSSIESLESDAAKFKLTIRVEYMEGKPCVALHCNDALYSPGYAQDVARSIVVACEHMLADANAPVRHVSLIDDERRNELDRFHEEATGPADFRTYHGGLEQQAKSKPQDTALIATDGTFTFSELNGQANRIAHALIERGVARGSRIALLLPRTSRVIMSMFGVMKAGCAYIPCDPTYPEERVNHILDDSAAPIVITTADRVPSYPNAVDVEELLACKRDDDPGIDVSPDDLAYLIYTSGSTGKPKGVMLTHAGVCNFHTNHPSNILVDALVKEAHAFLSVTTLSFDMSVKEVGTPLVNGLTVVLADESQVNDPAKLAELFEKTGADAFNATHSRLKQYLELPAFAASIGRCKVVLSGGEKYSEGLLPKLQRITEARIINTYGPTETTVSSNMADLTHATRISVGRPLYNVRECIVDSDGNELPRGVVGELLIGGAGVGAGYNNLPDKTAEAFIDWQGRRMYRSGDYARWTPEGDVEILGRTDNQIKLHGLRIEIGEVESALAAIEGVTNAIVKIARIGAGEHLCAYFTANRPLNAADVRDELATTLAKYMVPTAYLQLDALPLTPNGKVDFKNLPTPELLRSGESVAAANEVEHTFCTIFQDILGIDDVGATDSFFEIGGTSLLAIRITVEAANAGYQITYSDVFANPTPRDLANLCGATDQEDSDDASRDAEIEDFDYSEIDALLAQNNLRSFMGGGRRALGNLLITGAVGYLGIHILHEYLENYTGTVYCLLRGHGDITAEARLKHQLFYYFERNYAELFGTRIIVLEGDVTQDLPVNEEMHIDTVVNCAAVVKHFSAGTEIEDVNVGGVAKLVEFCLEHDVPLIQISTGSTVKCALKPDAEVMGKVTEQELYIGQDLANKYTRSKFLAERLVLDAVARRGLTAKVMRVGNLAPRTADGEFQINYATNAAMGRLKSFAMLGCAPYEQLDSTMEFSPIDETARAILLLAQAPAACVLFHSFNHHAVLYGDVFTAMGKCGLPVQPVERMQFSKALQEAEADPKKARVLTSMLAYARRPSGKPVVVPQAGNAYTMQVLYRMGFSWNPTPITYIEQFLDGLTGLGFFDEEE